jgi:hypothetical protein
MLGSARGAFDAVVHEEPSAGGAASYREPEKLQRPCPRLRTVAHGDMTLQEEREITGRSWRTVASPRAGRRGW